MDEQQQALTDEYLRLLARTGLDYDWPAIPFVPFHDGGEHVECNDDGTWTMMTTDRGAEYNIHRYTERHELMFALCAAATWEAAAHEVRERDTQVDDLEEAIHARQYELLFRIEQQWAYQLKSNWQKWRKVKARMKTQDAIWDAIEARGRLQMMLLYGACVLFVAFAIWMTRYS